MEKACDKIRKCKQKHFAIFGEGSRSIAGEALFLFQDKYHHHLSVVHDVKALTYTGTSTPRYRCTLHMDRFS